MDAIDKINIRLKKILDYTTRLEKFNTLTAVDLQCDDLTTAAIERYFQLAIEAVIDIANLLNAEYRFPPADNAQKSILVLGDQGVLTKKFAHRFSAVAGFRNILVHHYIDIDYQKVADNLNHNLADFKTFCRSVAKFLK